MKLLFVATTLMAGVVLAAPLTAGAMSYTPTGTTPAVREAAVPEATPVYYRYGYFPYYGRQEGLLPPYVHGYYPRHHHYRHWRRWDHDWYRWDHRHRHRYRHHEDRGWYWDWKRRHHGR
jgi:hypothetical protein